MENFWLKCRHVIIGNENNEQLQLRKAIKNVWHWKIDRVWKKFRADKSEAMRQILLDRYLSIADDAIGPFIEVRDPNGGYEFHNVICASISSLESAIDSFDHGRDKEFESYCTPRIRRAIFAKVRSKDRKETLRVLWEKDCFRSRREMAAGRFRSMPTD